jgi:hypothetical protein
MFSGPRQGPGQPVQSARAHAEVCKNVSLDGVQNRHARKVLCWMNGSHCRGPRREQLQQIFNNEIDQRLP